MRREWLLACGAILLLTATGSGGPKEARPRARDVLVRILTDPNVWGKDFPTALAFWPSWDRLEEVEVAVLPDAVVGSKSYRSPEEAQKAAGMLLQPVRVTQPTPAFSALLRKAPRQPPRWLRPTVLPAFRDDRTARIAWSSRSIRLLAPNLSIATIVKRYGPPDEVRQDMVPSGREGRPVFLTSHRYAGGAVTFAESDWGGPGIVDRVILNVPAVAAALSREGEK